MRLKATFMLVLIAGCDQGSPPFDQLPLRDALRAAPEVIASMPERARIQLAARLETACAKDVAIDELPSSTTSTPDAMVVALDGVRQHRQSEPLIVGMISNGAEWPIAERVAPPHASGLPPIEGIPAVATAAMEDQALGSEAGAAVRALLSASGAHRLHRVVGWPAGAVAIDDTVYVNASWLVSLAPAGNEKMDGGTDGGAITGSASPGVIAPTGAGNPTAGGDLPELASAVPKLRGALPSGNRGDAGVVQQPSGYDPQPSAGGEAADACVQCADGCDTGNGDSCDSGDDPCAASSDDESGVSSDPCASPAEASDGSGADACANTSGDDAAACSGAGDGADAASCQVFRSHGHKNSGTRIWLCAPLAFLLFWRRS